MKGQMTSIRRYACKSLLLTLLICQAPLWADNLPEELLATGKPETELAGIDIRFFKLKDVIKLYGQPTRKIQYPKDPYGAAYVWELSQATLTLDVSSSKSGEQIGGIYVEGTAIGKLGTTGRGLKFSDDIATLKRIYGDRFELRPPRGGSPEGLEDITATYQTATIEWGLEGFNLMVGFDSHGKVAAMFLILPECYPDGCND